MYFGLPGSFPRNIVIPALLLAAFAAGSCTDVNAPIPGDSRQSSVTSGPYAPDLGTPLLNYLRPITGGWRVLLHEFEVNPHRRATSVHIEYGVDPDLSSFSSSPIIEIGIYRKVVRRVTFPIGTAPVYYYRAVAENSDGVTLGAIRRISTQPLAAVTGLTLAHSSSPAYRITAAFTLPAFDNDGNTTLSLMRRLSASTVTQVASSPWPADSFPADSLVNAASFTSAELTSGGVHTYYVRRCAPYSRCSSTADATISFAPLGTADSLAAQPLTNGIALTWQDHATGETSLRVLRRDTATLAEQITTLPPNATAWTDTTAVRGAAYAYTVAPCVGTVCAAASNQVIGIWGTSIGRAPTITTPLYNYFRPRSTGWYVYMTGTVVDANSLATTVHFDVGTMSDLSDAVSTAPVSAGAAANPKTLANLYIPIGTAPQYYYRAVATNAKGTAYGAILPLSTLPPPIPTNIALTFTTSPTYRVVATFDPPPFVNEGQTTVRLLRRVGTGPEVVAAEVEWPVGTAGPNAIADTSSFSSAELTNGATHRYRIQRCPPSPRTCGASGEVTITIPPLGVMHSLTADGVTGGIQLSWTDAATGESSVQIWRRLLGGSTSRVAILPQNSTSWTDTAVTPGYTYIYYVQACTGYCSTASNEASAASL
jgi:hypothetical protein